MGRQGEKKHPGGGEKVAASPSSAGHAQVAKWQSCCHGSLPHLKPFLAGTDRCVKPRGQLESRGLTLPCLFLLLPRSDSDGHGEDGREEGKKGRDGEGKNKRDRLPPPPSPRHNQRDIAGGKLCELSLPTGPRASCGDRWLTKEKPSSQLWDLFALSPYQPCTVHSVSPVPPPPLRRITNNKSVASQSRQPLKERESPLTQGMYTNAVCAST